MIKLPSVYQYLFRFFAVVGYLYLVGSMVDWLKITSITGQVSFYVLWFIPFAIVRIKVMQECWNNKGDRGE
jgi:hypothetical protein